MNFSTPMHQNNYITAFVNNMSVKAMADSGASISCCSHLLLKRLMPTAKVIKCSKYDVQHIYSVSGEAIDTIAKCILPLQIQGKVFTHHFYVFNKLHCNLILGYDWLKHFGASIDVENSLLHLRDSNITADLHVKKHIGLARVCHTSTIPSNSECIIPVKISNCYNTPLVLLENVPSLPCRKIPLMIGRCLVKHKNSVIKVLNCTDDDIVLPRKAVIAKAYNICTEEDSILPFSSPHENMSIAQHAPVNSAAVSRYTDNSNLTNGKQSASDSQLIADWAKTAGISISKAAITTDQKEKLMHVLYSYRDRFSTGLSDLGCTHLYEHEIHMKDDKPLPFHRAYRYTPTKAAELERQVLDMAQHGIVRETHFPTCSHPMVLVKKGNTGTFRVTCDLRSCNQQMIPQSYPLPLFRDVINVLGENNACLFTNLDLMSAFHQLPLKESCKPLTTFTIASNNGECFFEYERVPQGLQSGSVSLQRFLSHLFQSLNCKKLLIYCDDILLMSNSFDDFLTHLTQVMDTLRHANLTLKGDKCAFAQSSTTYLGYKLSKNGLEIYKDKIDPILSFEYPTDVKSTRQLLGMFQYYKRFIPRFAEIASPLFDLLKHDHPFEFTPDCERACDTLKHCLVNSPCLIFPNFTKPFCLTCDASERSIAYTISQLDDEGRDHPILFGGRKLTSVESHRAIVENELLAIVTAIMDNQYYFSLNKFTIFTDNKALTYLRKFKGKNGRLLRWSLLLDSFTFDIIHKRSAENHMDALSRRQYENTPSPSYSDETIASMTLSPNNNKPTQLVSDHL